MMIVKITAMLVLITAIYLYIWKLWVKSNPEEKLKMTLNRSYLHKSGYPIILFTILDIIGILASAIYLLFIR